MTQWNFDQNKFLILRCTSKERKCGGLADRLKSLPFFIALAAKSNRIFLIRWDRPAKLEEFLIPNEINWSVPEWMIEKINQGNVSTSMRNFGTALLASSDREIPVVLEGLVQDFYGGSRLYHQIVTSIDNTTYPITGEELGDKTGYSEYERLFRDLFRGLFTPSLPISQLLRERLQNGQLIPGNYTSCHHRAFYAIEGKKHLRNNRDLRKEAINAVNCAAKLQPGLPVYFASDSLVSVTAVRAYARKNKLAVEAPIHDESNENLHLDRVDSGVSRNASDYYATFVDLLMLSNGRCLAYGAGGFGRFGALLSEDPTCTVHHGRRGETDNCVWIDENEPQLVKNPPEILTRSS
jgi:hypothetical protein